MCQVWRFYFQPFWFYRADRQTDRQTHRMTDRQNHRGADQRYTHAATVGMSNYTGWAKLNGADVHFWLLNAILQNTHEYNSRNSSSHESYFHRCNWFCR